MLNESNSESEAGAQRRIRSDDRRTVEEMRAYIDTLKRRQGKFRAAHPSMPSGWLDPERPIPTDVPLAARLDVTKYREREKRIRASEDAVGAMAPSRFWKDRQAEFEKYAKQYSDLEAHWRAAFGEWILWWGSTPSGINVPQECVGVFSAIARTIVAELPGSVNGDPEPWRLWLDFMRVKNWGFQVTGHTPCTEREWDDGVRDGKPLVEIRRKQKYTNDDEWKKVYERTAGGKLRRLTARELKGKSSEDLRKYYHWIEDGKIEHVFETSARFCEDLAARAYEMEAATSTIASGDNFAPEVVVGQSTDPEFWRRAKENFRRLQPRPPQPGEVARDSHNGLGACWNPNGWSGGDTWRLVDASNQMRKYFRIAAESAAVELGHPGGPSSLSFWLDHIRREGLHCKPSPGGIEIYRLCDASAEYCLRCETNAKAAARNRQLLLEQRSTRPGQPPAAREETPVASGVAGGKVSETRRGRPQSIPDERKVAALKSKNSGGTNKQAAALIYDTKYPTSQQVKNVPGILRHFREKSKQSDSPITPREAARKRGKTRG